MGRDLLRALGGDVSMSTRVQGMTIQKEVSNPNSLTSQGDCSLQVEIAPRSTTSGIVPLHRVYI